MVNVSRKSDDRCQFTLVKTKSYQRLLKKTTSYLHNY